MKSLFIFVEGPTDETFFENIIKPRIKDKYTSIKIIPYRNKKKDKIDGHVKSIKRMGAEYIYTCDLDHSCDSEKVRETKINEKINNIANGNPSLEEDRITIIIQEIESWYLAGIKENLYKKVGIRNSKKIPNYELISKEMFRSFCDKEDYSSVMLNILECYDFGYAIENNRSLKEFSEKYIKSKLNQNN